MIYLALGCLALLAWLWVGKAGRARIKRREWRLLTAGVSLAAFTGAAFVGMRGAWGSAIVLTVAGLWLASTARQYAGASVPNPGELTKAQARTILGVADTATQDEIHEAYTRLMRRTHPDQGGTDGLAAQVNAARDRLLKP